MKKLVKILVLLPLLLGTAKMGAQVTIGADAVPKAFSVLELVAQYETNTYGGLRLPQMTTAQRDALGDFTSVADAYGLMIYNTTVNCVEYWNSKKWVSLCTGTADITLTGDCATDHLFDADGSEACTFTPEDNPPCVMSSGASYQVYLTAGSAYATLVVDELTSAFTLTFAPNNSHNPRIAVVRVTNCCSSEYQDFPFYQDGAQCPIPQSGLTLATSPASATLCGDNGAVIAWVDSPEPGMDYVWEYGGAIVHTGTYMQITYPGTYTVYVGLLYCEETPPQSITVTKGGGGSSSNAPTLSATNGGILCGNGGVVILTAGGLAAGNTVQWFHNGELCTTCLTNPLMLSGASAAGEWFATQQDGSGCGSKMSATVTLHDQTTSSVALDPPSATVNGMSLTGSPVICKGGTLELEVTNTYPAGTMYEWFDGTTSIYKGTDPIIYSVAPDKSSMTLSVQVSNNSGGCPNTATSTAISVDVVAPSAPTIDGGTLAICGSAPANLLALPSSYTDYEWFFNGTKITVPDANNPSVTTSLYKATLAGNYTVRYKDGDCWSLLSTAVTVVQSASISLNWQTPPPATVVESSTESYTVLASPSTGVTYEWSSDDPTLATVTQIGNTASIDFSDVIGGIVNITVTATNACGTVTLSAPIEIVSGCTPITSLTLSPAGPLTLKLDGSNNWITSGSQLFTANVLPTGSATNYEWFEGVTSKQSGASNQYNYAPPKVPDTYTVSVEATNGCSTKTASATVNVTQDNPVDVSGNYSIKGKTCYDVYVTDWLATDPSACMPKASRTDDFVGGYSFTYNFFNNGNFTGLTWELDPDVNDPASLVASAIPSGTNNEILTVTFKSDPVNGVKTKAAGKTRDFPLKVTIIAKYTDNTSQSKQVSLEISIQDCSCGCSVKTTAGTWLTFMCYNMGADPNMTIAQQMAHVPNPSGAASTDEKVYGWLYQWGRKADGHQERNSTAVSGGSGAITYTGGYDTNQQITTDATAYYGKHIYFGGQPYDWHGNSNASQNNDLWNHTTTLGKNNNPCDPGWRVPTQAEWGSIFRGGTTSGAPGTATANTWTWNSSGTPGYKISPDGGANYTLFLPAAGNRSSNSSALLYAGTSGNYWSSSVNGTVAYYLNFVSGTVNPGGNSYRANGFSLRCVAEQ